jgi:subtilisin family serine protease
MFVAAAGNDSDPRMNESEKRFGPRYPAAFAQDQDYPIPTMISVGAVNRNGDAALYSNYPGANGIATYGGDIPKPDPWLPSAMSHTDVHPDTTTPIDALCGLFSASSFPALSKNGQPSEVPAASTSAWAYWSGTSFAAPIMSALVARILQTRESKNTDVRKAMLDTAKSGTLWTSIDYSDVPGRLIMAVQEWVPRYDE